MSNDDLIVAAANANFLASSEVHAKACYYDSPYGCFGRYCWKDCGPTGRGQWCWFAANGGAGDRTKCITYDQCRVVPGADWQKL
ncbi:hypothetical protein FRX31_025919 [Thalictrum thalictroides]|uniref:Uncharacterized protein n=1 Tax=Thalictrum thalictroides TaxID=46969 RepID=A0A7J6VHC1_THATH|nr:hypothetical protein FRX31_025919 [Thalictrum thalictroides]